MTESDQKTLGRSAKIDLLTVSAIAIIVYFLCCFVHEAIGHGGAAVVQGVKVTKVSNAYCRQQGATDTQKRWIAAAGIPTNLLFAFAAFLVRSRFPRRENNGPAHYFLWLFAFMNLFSAGGYMATFAMLRIGDINSAVRGLPGETWYRCVIMIAGVVIIIWAFLCAGRSLEAFAGAGADRMRRGVALTLVPYLVGGTVNVGASLLGVGPTPLAIVLISSAGSTFGGNFPLVWTPTLMRASNDGQPAITPTRSAAWLIAGALCLAAYAVLGRGIEF